MSRPMTLIAGVSAVAVIVAAAWLIGRDSGDMSGADPDARDAGAVDEPLPELPSVLDAGGIEDILRAGPADPRFRALVSRSDWLDDETSEILLRFVEDENADMVLRDFSLRFLTKSPRGDVGGRLVDVVARQTGMPWDLEFRIFETIRDRGDVEQAPRIVALIIPNTVRPDTLWIKTEALNWLQVPPPLDALRAVLRQDDPVIRGGAGVALFYAQGSRVSPELDALLRRDADEIFRHEVLSVMARRGGLEDQRYLAGLVASSDADIELRRTAASLVPRSEDPETARLLLDIVAAGDAPGELLRDVARALGQTRATGVARRVRGILVSGTRPVARIAAAEAIRQARDREGLDDVRRALTDGPAAPPGLRIALVRALGEIGGRADRESLREIRETDPDETVRRAAEEALNRLDEILMSEPGR